MRSSMATTTVTKYQALERVQRNNLLVQVHTLEKQRLEQVVDLALMVEDPANRWHEYERLKKMASRFVGFDAQNRELATNQHYEVMIDFIDWMLPEMPLAIEMAGKDHREEL